MLAGPDYFLFFSKGWILAMIVSSFTTNSFKYSITLITSKVNVKDNDVPIVALMAVPDVSDDAISESKVIRKMLKLKLNTSRIVRKMKDFF